MILDEKAAQKEMQEKMRAVMPVLKSLETMPGTMGPMWEMFKYLELDKGVIPEKYHHLMGLAIASAISSEHFILAHTMILKMMDVKERETNEAIFLASETAGWSAYMHGRRVDINHFTKDIHGMMEHMRKTMGKTPPPQSGTLEEHIKKVLGRMPVFFEEIAKLPGQLEPNHELFRLMQMDDGQAIPVKYRQLIGLAVGSAIHCPYCTLVHTEVAKMAGANERELNETAYRAKWFASWATFLRGTGYPLEKFKEDINMVGDMKKMEMAAH
jgi:AhpD family alkylhydroperoxidase